MNSTFRLNFFLGILVLLLFLCSLSVGSGQLPVVKIWTGMLENPDSIYMMIMKEVRLPRALLGIMVGFSLGISGAAMQGFLRNPLAEPGLIGVSSGSALGAVIALQSGLAASYMFGLPFAALFGALITVVLILALAGTRASMMTLILAGIAISALAGALISLVLSLSPNPYAVSEIVFWMMGSIADRSMLHVYLALPFMLLGMALLLKIRPAFDALTMGEETAETLGFDLRHVRVFLVIGVASLVGSVTAVAGAIGFVGLVVPHLLRPWVQSSPSKLLVSSGLGGAAMILAADIATRLILPNGDLKLGVLTALVGAPLFLHLIYKTRRGEF